MWEERGRPRPFHASTGNTSATSGTPSLSSSGSRRLETKSPSTSGGDDAGSHGSVSERTSSRLENPSLSSSRCKVTSPEQGPAPPGPPPPEPPKSLGSRTQRPWTKSATRMMPGKGKVSDAQAMSRGAIPMDTKTSVEVADKVSVWGSYEVLTAKTTPLRPATRMDPVSERFQLDAVYWAIPFEDWSNDVTWVRTGRPADSSGWSPHSTGLGAGTTEVTGSEALRNPAATGSPREGFGCPP